MNASETANVRIFRRKGSSGNGDRVLSLANSGTRIPPFPTAAFVSDGTEGMVFNGPREGAVELYLYYDGTRFLSTTGDPPTTIPAYVKYWPDPIGWIAKPIE